MTGGLAARRGQAAADTDDDGSDEGRTRCAVWQSWQTAAVVAPKVMAFEWKLRRYEATASVSSPALAIRASSS